MNYSNTSPLRVAAYCRVSTNEADQLNSYEAQIAYYQDYIFQHKEWRLVKIYADKGISGTQTKNRTEFKKMLRQCRMHRIDLILCKSISRFARNTVDLLEIVRELTDFGIVIRFEKENIDTSEMNSEFMISLYASFAQAESESISRNITWGIEKSFQNGIVRYNMSQTLGYRMGEDGKPVIIEAEAIIVRRIYELFADGLSLGDIARMMTSESIARRNGSTSWTRKNVQQILINEKYAGDALLQKSYTVNCLTHKRAKNTGQKPQYLIENCHPAIIEKELYERVQEQFRLRRERRLGKVDTGKEALDDDSNHNSEKNTDKIKNQSHPEEASPFGVTDIIHNRSDKHFNESDEHLSKSDEHLIESNEHLLECNYLKAQLIKTHRKQSLNKVLICPYCNSHFRRVIWQYNGRHYAVWRCGARLEGGKAYCSKSPSIHEDVLLSTLTNAILTYYPNIVNEIKSQTTELTSLISDNIPEFISHVYIIDKMNIKIIFRDEATLETEILTKNI